MLDSQIVNYMYVLNAAGTTSRVVPYSSIDYLAKSEVPDPNMRGLAIFIKGRPDAITFEGPADMVNQIVKDYLIWLGRSTINVVPNATSLKSIPIWVLTEEFHDDGDYRHEVLSHRVFGTKPSANQLEELGVPGDICNAVWHGEDNPDRDGGWWFLRATNVNVPVD